MVDGQCPAGNAGCSCRYSVLPSSFPDSSLPSDRKLIFHFWSLQAGNFPSQSYYYETIYLEGGGGDILWGCAVKHKDLFWKEEGRHSIGVCSETQGFLLEGGGVGSGTTGSYILVITTRDVTISARGGMMTHVVST